MIHPALGTGEIARRYYRITKDRILTNEQARKAFIQDRNIDKNTLNRVISQIFKEAKNNVKKICDKT